MTKQSPPKISIIIAITALLVICIALFAIYKLDPGIKPGYAKSILKFSSQAKIGGNFDLIDEQENSFTHKDLVGKVNLIYFGFTYCPDICPTTLQNISVALDKLPKSVLNNTQVIFVSVDPERDDPKQLQMFIENFHPNITALTGPKAEIDKMAKDYKVYYRKIDHGDNSANYMIDHTSIIYVMGRDGQYIKHFSSKITAAEIVRELLKLHAK